MDIIAAMRAALPPVFLGSKIDELTGGAINWRTTQNRRSRGEIENQDEIFIRSGNRILVMRDPFLDWWATTLSDARQPSLMPPQRAHRVRGDEAARSAVDRVGPATARARPVLGGRDPPSAAPAAPQVVPARQLPRRQRRNRADEFANAVSSG
jgi:hypothetical protein